MHTTIRVEVSWGCFSILTPNEIKNVQYASWGFIILVAKFLLLARRPYAYCVQCFGVIPIHSIVRLFHPQSCVENEAIDFFFVVMEVCAERILTPWEPIVCFAKISHTVQKLSFLERYNSTVIYLHYPWSPFSVFHPFLSARKNFRLGPAPDLSKNPFHFLVHFDKNKIFLTGCHSFSRSSYFNISFMIARHKFARLARLLTCRGLVILR